MYVRLLILAALLAGCTTTTQTATPENIARQFCKITQSGDDTAFLSLAGPELSLLVQKAQQDNDTIAKRVPDEKPPLGDGLPLQAAADYAPICKVGTVTRTLTKTVVEIHHGFTGKNAPYGWTDKLILTPDGIDEVLFGPGYTNGLRSSLAAAFAQ